MTARTARLSRLLLAMLSMGLLGAALFFLVKGAWWLSLGLAVAEAYLEGSSPTLFRRTQPPGDRR
jgi:hypothetical protein